MIMASRWLWRARRITAAEIRLIAEAQLVLVTCQITRWLRPTGRLLTSESEQQLEPATRPDYATAARIGWAVTRAARYGLFRPKCLVRSLAVQRMLRRRGIETPHLAGGADATPPEDLRGNIENFIGMAQVPVGLIGPLRVAGLHVREDVYAPLATTEGALVASYHRGARLLSRAGGVVCLLTQEHVQRAPAFAFPSLAEAAHFAVWAVDQADAFREVAATRTSHGRLVDVATHVEANHVYLIFSYETGDAAGQNMVTLCTAAVLEHIIAHSPVTPEYYFLEGNLSGDKKATAMSFLHGRGRTVTAEACLPRVLVERGLRTTPERMCDYWRMSFVAGVQQGSIGVSGHIANGIAALFLATGQDVACVSEASVGITRMETRGDDLYIALTLPNLIVGTVGGGTLAAGGAHSTSNASSTLPGRPTNPAFPDST